jgi:hypothetical protein
VRGTMKITATREDTAGFTSTMNNTINQVFPIVPATPHRAGGLIFNSRLPGVVDFTSLSVNTWWLTHG